MNRRHLILTAAGLFTSGVIGSTFHSSAAQSDSIISETLSQRVWLIESEFKLRTYLAYALTDIRIAYNGPNGYEGDEGYAQRAFDVLSRSFGTNSEHTASLIERAESMIRENLEKTLHQQMTDALTANGEVFFSWLEELGVTRGSRMQMDFLRAQALFAVFAALELGEGDLSAVSDDTWSFPVC